MQLNYILNNQKLNIPSTVLHNAATAVGNAEINITGQDAIIIDVSGEFVANITLAEKYTGGAYVSKKEIYDIETEEIISPLSIITKPGKYLIRNLYGCNVLRVRIDKYTSGNVTVRVCSVDVNSVRQLFPNKSALSKIAMQDKTGNGSSKYVESAQFDCLILKVSGTFDAAVIIYGKYKDNDTSERINTIYNVDNPLISAINITKPGTYAIRNLERYDYIIPSILNYTSGAVTVRVSPADMNSVFGAITDRNRQILLKEQKGVTIAAGETLETGVLDFSPFAFVYCMLRCDVSHSYKAYVTFRSESNTLGATVPPTDMIDGSVMRAASEWIECKGTKGVFGVTNRSDAEHTYDAFFYGIR